MVDPFPLVILAGGRGTRIGGGKPERQLAGASLMMHAVGKARGYSLNVAVSVGNEERAISAGSAVLIHDEGDIQGPVAGLATALKFGKVSGARHVMIMPCDTPFLPVDLARRLSENIGDAVAAVASCAGQLQPACSLWRTDAAEMLPEYLAAQRRSLIGFAERVGYVAVE